MSYKLTKWDMVTWKVTQKVKHFNFDFWQFVEHKIARKILFLKKDTMAIDWLEPVEGKPYATLNSDKLTDSMLTHYGRFHGQPRREYYMDQVIRFCTYKWHQPIWTFKRWCRSRLDWFLFFRARELTWKTHHYINRSGTDHIDGYFEFKVFGIKGTRTVDLCSIQCLKHDAYEWDFVKKKNKKILNYHDLNRYGKWGFPTILVLKDKIMPKDIDKVLAKWYDDQVEYKYRHWTWKGDRPKIIVDDLHFMEDPCEKCGLDMYGCTGHYGESKEKDAT